MATETVIDRYYLHISNGGYTYETKQYDSKFKDTNSSWELSIALTNHGLVHESLIHLSTLDQIDTLQTMLANVRERMVKDYGETGKPKHNSLSFARPIVVDTYKAVNVYGELEGDENNGGRALLGYNLVDNEGNIQSFVENKVEGLGNYWGACCSAEDKHAFSVKNKEKTNTWFKPAGLSEGGVLKDIVAVADAETVINPFPNMKENK